MANGRFNGPLLRELREKKGWTIYDLAERLGTSPMAISYWERGKNTPRWDYACDLRKLFGVALGRFEVDEGA